MAVLSEQGLYFFLARSDKPLALPFQKWIAGEVPPSIRRHGAYMTEPTIDRIMADPDFGIALLTQLKEERRKNSELAVANKTLQLENETLEIALGESLKFYTVAKYDKAYNKNWTVAECQKIGKSLSAYCRARAVEIRKCETNDERFGAVNSYPLAAWESFMQENQHETSGDKASGR
jgi:prophage antirepressor-like protein